MDQDQTNPSQTGSPDQPAAQPQPEAPGGATTGDEVLGLISHVEDQLAGLKKAHEVRRLEMAELRDQRATLAQHERELASRSDELRARIESIESRETQHEQSLAQLRVSQDELDTLAEQLRTQSDELEARAAALEARQGDLDEHERSIAQRRAELDEDHAQAQTLRDQLAALAQEHQAAIDRADGLERQLDELGDEVRERADKAEQLETRLASADEQAAQLNDRIEQLEHSLDHETSSRDERLAHLEAQLAETTEQIERRNEDHAQQLRAQAEHLAAEHAEVIGQHEARSEELADEIQQARTQLDELQADRARAIDQLTDRHRDESERFAGEIQARDELIEELETARGELQARAEQTAGALDERDEQISVLGAQITAERGRFTTSLQEHTELVLSLENDLQEQADEAEKGRAAADRLERERDALSRRIDELERLNTALDAQRDDAGSVSATYEQQLRERGEELESLRAQAEQLREQLGEANQRIQSGTSGHESEVEQFIAETERLSGELQRRDDRLAQLEQALAEASDARAQLETDRDTMGEQIDQVAALRDELAGRDARIESLLDEIKRCGSGRATSAWIETRTRRLKRSRELMHVQSLKIRRASDLLTRRFEQCEGLLRQRSDVVAAARRVASVEKRINRKRASFRASWTVFGILLSLVLLGGASWVAAGSLAPATYAASMSIVADANGRELTEAELNEWQTYHEQLLNDPRLIERTAERMKRRGINDLADPAVLGTWLDAHLAQVSVTPGRLDLELRGSGRAKTRRTLETYAAAVISEANATRERRAVGVADRLDGELRLGSPLDTERPVYAAIGAGAGIVLLGILGLVLWRKLAGVKSAFEHEEHIESVLDEARWVSPTDHT